MKHFALESGALIALFAAVTGVAMVLGAANLGTAAAFGQIGFLAGVAYVLLRRPTAR